MKKIFIIVTMMFMICLNACSLLGSDISGEWYSANLNETYIFNDDGTGTWINTINVSTDFTYEMEEEKLYLTYTMNGTEMEQTFYYKLEDEVLKIAYDNGDSLKSYTIYERKNNGESSNNNEPAGNLTNDELITIMDEAKRLSNFVEVGGAAYVNFDIYREYNNNYYYKIESDYSNLDELKSAMFNIYTDSVVENILSNGYMVDIDGELYSLGLGAGGMERPCIKVEATKVSDENYSVEITSANFKQTDYGYDFTEVDNSTASSETVNLVYDNGKWKFEDMPHLLTVLVVQGTCEYSIIEN